MCGIIAYKGNSDAIDILTEGLYKLEYRGYDSVGISIISNGDMRTYKQTGSIEDLLVPEKEYSNIGIGHTRWATHGKACARNSHPHVTFDKRLAIVHNGIVENYAELKGWLSKKYKLVSDTDSEVLLYLIYDILKDAGNVFDSVKIAIEKIVGAYAFVVIDKEDPDVLVCAKKGSSLCIGVEDNNYYIASDVNAFSKYTNNIISMNDGYISKISNTIEHYDSNIKDITSCNIEKVYNHTYNISKENYDTFMRKEIFEQPKAVSDCMKGRVDGYNIKLGGFDGRQSAFKRARRITIVACGSSWHSALLGKYYIEELSNVPINVEYASEFRYRNPVIENGDIIIGISQSGETADTLAALSLAKDKGAITVGICNTVNSQMSKMTEFGMYTRCGIEVGVASTKAFTNQCLCLLMLALWLDQHIDHSDRSARKKIINEMKDLPEMIAKAGWNISVIREIADKCFKTSNCLFLGRKYNFPIALEGALKMKEISYIHAEGYPAAEMKHGPIALIDKNMPVVIIANHIEQYEKVVSNKLEIEARDGKTIAIISDTNKNKVGNYDIVVPGCHDIVSPFVSVVPLQLLALHVAQNRGCNVDRPRNLAKSVTVE